MLLQAVKLYYCIYKNEFSFADDLVRGFQHALEQFAAKCETAGMGDSTSEVEVVIQHQQFCRCCTGML